jgi:predicted transcriptional regulator of viral defense system
MGKHVHSIDRRILSRIRAQGKGRVFTPADFLDLGTRAAVDQALSRNTRAGILRKVGRGLYDLPRSHPLFGRLSTTTDAVAKAVAKRDKATLHTSGAHAANILGLSDQVPMKLVFLTDGRKRRIQVGKSPLILKHTTARTVKTKNPTSALVIQALRWIGRKHVDDDIIARLRRNLKPADRAALVQDAPQAPGWIADIFHRLAKD